MPMFSIRLVTAEGERVENVDADYYRLDEEFVTFKTEDHKQIASYFMRNVISVTRQERKATIGTVVVNVAPELDEEAMQRLIERIEERSRAAATNGGR